MEGLRNELEDKSEQLNKLKSLLGAKEEGLNKTIVISSKMSNKKHDSFYYDSEDNRQ